VEEGEGKEGEAMGREGERGVVESKKIHKIHPVLLLRAFISV